MSSSSDQTHGEPEHEPHTAESNSTELVEHVTIIEYNDTAKKYDRPAGERAIRAGSFRGEYVHDDDRGGFVKVGQAVAIIDLHEPLEADKVTEWSDSTVGKLALSHWFDNVNPEEVVKT